MNTDSIPASVRRLDRNDSVCSLGNRRSGHDSSCRAGHQIQAGRRAALDWYSAVRSAYTQSRENQIQDKRGATEDRQYYPGTRGQSE